MAHDAHAHDSHGDHHAAATDHGSGGGSAAWPLALLLGIALLVVTVYALFTPRLREAAAMPPPAAEVQVAPHH